MINVLFTAFMLTALPNDTIPPTREQTDTLKEVEVIAPESTAALNDAIRQSLARMGVSPHTPNLGEVLNKIAPSLQDRILHPFGFKERRQARKRKRVQKILDDFDKAQSFDELLREALKREGIVIPEKKDAKSK
ncbi:MAG: hypothetical protein K5672_07025 [Bacteroidaceae bacterium]|jgi:hypothetical protein|nr:hypothetical protein [Bacteroidaceae bacterium]